MRLAQARWKRAAGWAMWAALIAALVLSAGGAFGMSGGDVKKLAAFADAVRRWERGPEFRSVEREYVTLGVAAMRTRLCGQPASKWVMWFRSLPGIPKYLSVDAGSAAHYRAFSESELAAYVHLSGEQGLSSGVEMVEKLAAKPDLSDGEIVAFLDGFKLPVSIPHDEGAVQSVRRLLFDVGPKPLAVRDEVVHKLRPYMRAVAAREEADPQEALDALVRASDPELWRTKQVNDFLAGVWAVGYGQIYLDAIEGLFVIQQVARVVFIVLLVITAGLLIMRWRRGRAIRTTSASSAQC